MIISKHPALFAVPLLLAGAALGNPVAGAGSPAHPRPALYVNEASKKPADSKKDVLVEKVFQGDQAVAVEVTYENGERGQMLEFFQRDDEAEEEAERYATKNLEEAEQKREPFMRSIDGKEIKRVDAWIAHAPGVGFRLGGFEDKLAPVPIADMVYWHRIKNGIVLQLRDRGVEEGEIHVHRMRELEKMSYVIFQPGEEPTLQNGPYYDKDTDSLLVSKPI